MLGVYLRERRLVLAWKRTIEKFILCARKISHIGCDYCIWSGLSAGIIFVFIQLCSMARDMNAEVRIEAFLALGKIQPISDDVLLQGLSKKVLGTKTDRKVLTKFTSMEIVSLVASAAGAFIHGLEDELSEVFMTLNHVYMTIIYFTFLYTLPSHLF